MGNEVSSRWSLAHSLLSGASGILPVDAADMVRGLRWPEPDSSAGASGGGQEEQHTGNNTSSSVQQDSALVQHIY